MPFCSREHRELYRLLHDREPAQAPVKVRSITSLPGGDTQFPPPRASRQTQDAAQSIADGNCQFCGKALPIFARLRGTRFCNSDHEASFHQRQTQETLERLAAGQRRQVNPGSVRIRQRTKPPTQPNITHQPPAPPAVFAWQKTDLTPRTGVPHLGLSAPATPVTLLTPRTDCLAVGAGIWPSLPDEQAKSHWSQMPQTVALPSPAHSYLLRPGFAQAVKIDIPAPPPAGRRSTSTVTAAYLHKVSSSIHFPASPGRYPYQSFAPFGPPAFHHWTVSPVGTTPALPIQSIWRIKSVPSMLIAAAPSAILLPGAPSRTTASPLRTPVSATTERLLPPSTLCWRTLESSPCQMLTADRLQPLTTNPAGSTFLPGAATLLAANTVFPGANWIPGVFALPFNALTAAAQTIATVLPTRTRPAPPPPPALLAARSTSSAALWATVSLEMAAPAASRHAYPESRPNRVAACAIRHRLAQAHPRIRTRPPIQRLRMPALARGFASVIA